MIQQITKPAYNEEFRIMEFRRPDGKGQLNADETVNTCTVLATEYTTGADRTSEMISEVGPYNQTCVKYKLKGGAPGSRYKVEARIVTSNGQKLADSIIVRVE